MTDLSYFSWKIHQTPLCVSEVHIMLEIRVVSGTSYTRHVVFPVFAGYFCTVSKTVYDVPVDTEHRPSVV
jgi:hypothetical protein